MTKLEQVARAIGRKRGDFGDEIGWLGEETHARVLEEARAALIALQEPTQDMTLAGAKAGVDQIYYKQNSWDRCMDHRSRPDYLNFAKFSHRAMIASVLSEKQEGQ